ncbi:MAG: PHP domain-containing protein [Spongiibacteraceae bacterium]
MIVDFHSHSTASDGALPPLELLRRAQDNGVELMAITDHDSIAGYLEVRDQWNSPSMGLIPGVELSCIWGKRTIHIVGLGFDADNPVMQQGLADQQQARLKRARLIDDKLAKYGFVGSFDFVVELAGGSQIGRPHFAQFLVEKGHVANERMAFKRYLGAGKPGDIKQMWPELAAVVGWIKASGGAAVLAHPLHYDMTATKLRALIADFKTAGGDAVEVISGKQQSDRTQYLAQLAGQFELHASIGSDFHKPGLPWRELGQMGVLPKSCRPVWSLLEQCNPVGTPPVSSQESRSTVDDSMSSSESVV